MFPPLLLPVDPIALPPRIVTVPPPPLVLAGPPLKSTPPPLEVPVVASNPFKRSVDVDAVFLKPSENMAVEIEPVGFEIVSRLSAALQAIWEVCATCPLAPPYINWVAVAPRVWVSRSIVPVERAVRSSEPAVRVARSSEPVERVTRSSEPVVRVARSSEPVERVTRSSEPVVRAARSSEPVERVTRSSEPVVSVARSTAKDTTCWAFHLDPVTSPADTSAGSSAITDENA